jgi:hypothetical protein
MKYRSLMLVGNSLMVILLLINLLDNDLAAVIISILLILIDLVIQFFCLVNNKESDLIFCNILVGIIMFCLLGIYTSVDMQGTVYEKVFEVASAIVGVLGFVLVIYKYYIDKKK